MTMEPLRIDFVIAGLVGRGPHPIHLDSLVAHQLVRRDLGPSPDPKDALELLEKLPLARRTIGNEWVWAASSIAFTWSGPAVQFPGTRAFRASTLAADLDVIARTKITSQINTGSGHWKCEQYAVEAQQATNAVAYAIGMRDELTDLLGRIHTIGARRRHETAAVISVTITPDETAEHRWQCRYLPRQAEITAPLREGAFRLPLFDRANRTVIKDNHLRILRDACA